MCAHLASSIYFTTKPLRLFPNGQHNQILGSPILEDQPISLRPSRQYPMKATERRSMPNSETR